MSAVDALRAVDFDWARLVRDVWSDPLCDVALLNEALRQELRTRIAELAKSQEKDPRGWVLVGSGGTGKTHLLAVVRREAFQRRLWFVLVDMTDVRDFWETLLLSYVTSLQMPAKGGKLQHRVLLEQLLRKLRPWRSRLTALVRFGRKSATELARDTTALLSALRRGYPQEAMRYQDIIRALIALSSEDFELASLGLNWLHGQELDEQSRAQLKISRSRDSAMETVRGLSWLMSLVAPTILAFDQLDSIVAEMNMRSASNDPTTEETAVARGIIESIAGGLGAIRDVTYRTFAVVACIEQSWHALTTNIQYTPSADRFDPPRPLQMIHSGDLAEELVRSRLQPAYQQVGFEPPYPTWPFPREALDGVQGLSPRQILQVCEKHRQRCLHEGRVWELSELSLAPAESSAPTEPPSLQRLDERRAEYEQQADPEWLLEEKADDERLAPLLQDVCRCLIREHPLPQDTDAIVDTAFGGGRTSRPLHARVRLTYHEQGDREEHFCLRALQRRHANAFQARLKAAMTHSGIDRRLSFRRLTIVRRDNPPGGQVTRELIREFQDLGGILVSPTEQELQTLWALSQLLEEKDPDLEQWLRSRQPASRLPLMREAVPQLCVEGNGETPSSRGEETEQGGTQGTADPSPGATSNRKGSQATQEYAETGASRTDSAYEGAENKNTPALTGVSGEQRVPLGRRVIADRPSEPLTIPVEALEKHAVVLAGAGSGKTVLLRRLIEETTLLGVPSIVIDYANDLSTLGERWPEPPEQWQPTDAGKADRYHQKAEVVVWTPGRETGNPLILEPLPDLRLAAEDIEQLELAVEMARESLREVIAEGSSTRSQNKAGILSAALKFFAREGAGSLQAFIDLLADLPPEAGLGIQNEQRLAREMADRLRVETETNPLLRDSGAGLDPAILFGDDGNARDKTRVSVINFVGLPARSSQQLFVNQLAMTLFSWLRAHPAPPNRRLRGLLVIDEAKDFIPARESTACKPSLMRLAAQARKYHLGVIFATQNPKEIENTVIGNCSTHYYGKASSPAAIQAVREQIHLRGGRGDDIGTLSTGQFYAYNADSMSEPAKVQIPLCLSHHRPDPLEETEILERAAASRDRLQSRRGTC